MVVALVKRVQALAGGAAADVAAAAAVACVSRGGGGKGHKSKVRERERESARLVAVGRCRFAARALAREWPELPKREKRADWPRRAACEAAATAACPLQVLT
jgi:hypothetical protein